MRGRADGSVNQYTGDGIMALFGAPLAHKDHAQRACYTALGNYALGNIMRGARQTSAAGGAALRSWKFFDLYDPQRRGFGSFATLFYEEAYKEVLEEPGYDWMHTNSVYYLPEEDAAVEPQHVRPIEARPRLRRARVDRRAA